MATHPAVSADGYWARRELACALTLGATGLPCVQAGVELLIDTGMSGGIPLDLRDALTSLDPVNLALTATAVEHAAGLPAPGREHA
jgi:hypothetical protein